MLTLKRTSRQHSGGPWSDDDDASISEATWMTFQLNTAGAICHCR